MDKLELLNLKPNEINLAFYCEKCKCYFNSFLKGEFNIGVCPNCKTDHHKKYQFLKGNLQ